MKRKFQKRVWLNAKGHPSTGSLFIHDGDPAWAKARRTVFIEIASCNEIARLHRTDMDTDVAWHRKVRKLISGLVEYEEFLARGK